jgi:hypothetical protein
MCGCAAVSARGAPACAPRVSTRRARCASLPAVQELRKRPEGWRTLRVGELELWWSVGEPRATAWLADQPGKVPSQAIVFTLSVARADGSGKTLVVTVRGQRALAVPAAGFGDRPTIAIEAGAVRRIVEQAAPRGAWPTGRGTWTAELALRRPLPRSLTLEDLEGVALVSKHA